MRASNLLLALTLLLASTPSLAAVHNKKVAVVYINPVNPNNPSQRLMAALGWAEQTPMTPQVIDTISRATNGRVAYTVAASYTVDQFPPRVDGQTWTWDNYYACATYSDPLHNQGRFPPGFCTPPNGGYNTLMTSLTGQNLCSQISSGQIDEVWIWAPYYTGFDEFAYKVPHDRLYYKTKENNGALYDARRFDLPDCGRPYFVMGFVSDAGIGNTIHSYGHRIESALSLSAPGQGYFGNCGISPSVVNEWTQYVCYDKVKPGSAACGDVHEPPNATQGYDYGNARWVQSSCQDWLNYPNLTGSQQAVNVSTWLQTGSQAFAGNDHASFMEWWLNHLPHNDGSHVDAHGVTIANDWWHYILNYQDPYNSLPTNIPPIANAGPDQYGVAVGSWVTLDGRYSSDPDGEIVSYDWGHGLTGSVTSTSFNAPGDYPITLTVTDADGATANDTLVVHVVYANRLPKLSVRGTNNNWGNTAMNLVSNNLWATDVTFGSTSSERFKFDVNGDWSLNYGDTNRDGLVETNGADIPVTQGAGSYHITYNDLTQRYTLVKNVPNQNPIARAGNDLTVYGPVGTVTLSAAGSSDPDGDSLSYSWIQTAGRPISLSNATSVNPSFVLNSEPQGTSTVPYDSYEFKVTVSDGRGGQASDYVVVQHEHSPSTVQLLFKPSVSTVNGQNVYIVGNLPALSNWNSAAGLPCTTSAATYPVWSCQALNLAPGTTFEYKYIKRDGSGNVIWESGANRARTAPNANSTYSESWK